MDGSDTPVRHASIRKGSSLTAALGALLVAGVALLVIEALVARPVLAQECPGDGAHAVPTDVAVTAVPIVVTSTAADYFVLYVTHVGNGATTVEYPVAVVLGHDGTTELSENVAALPAERYRVEKYSIDHPGDVDGDCIDDITELANPGMNPVNPGKIMDPSVGAVAIADREAFEVLAHPYPNGTLRMKFSIVDAGGDRPAVYFQDTNAFPSHPSFYDAVGIVGALVKHTERGQVFYDPELSPSDGSGGAYHFVINDPISLSDAERTYTLLAASMPMLDNNLALWIPNQWLPQIQADLPLYRSSRMSPVLEEDVYDEIDFEALNNGEGYGMLRSLDPDERPRSRDVVIYETLPNELPRVAGIISTVPQTPLSHVNLRALQDRVPNAFIADALDDETISNLIDSHVHYAVTDTGYTIRAATQEEVDAYYTSSRPAEAQTPERDLTVTTITPLSEIGFDDWDSFGVKAANVAVLGTLGFPEGTVPGGFAVPFYFYDEFMKHNGFYEDIEEMLGDEDFRTDYDEKASKLKKLRKNIKKGDVPEWIETALTEMHETYPEGQSLRYRSSTNNEDLPGFNGAGLYDSKTQHPEETEEDGIAKSLKQLYASLWNFRAFIERDFHRVDHFATAMGVLVHPNYSDELVNGVAVSVDPSYGTNGSYYVNSQVGEDLVTNPEAHSVPEEALLWPDGIHSVASLSNQVPLGQLLMTDDQMRQLRQHLEVIHDEFEALYSPLQGEDFAMEIEFKITSDSVLAIKQARPWIFPDSPPTTEAVATERTEDVLTANFDVEPETHDGDAFSVRVRFSEGIWVRFALFRDYSVMVTDGRVNRVKRVDGRLDLWDIEIVPDSPRANVYLALAANRACTTLGAVCTRYGGQLSNGLELTVQGVLPSVPDRATGRASSSDTVVLEWNDALRAESYEVQFRHSSDWLDLPAGSVRVEFEGAGVVVTGLPASDTYHFRVRAVNPHGTSEWSDSFLLPILSTAVENSSATGSPTIGGTVQVGETLTADVSGIEDADGMTNVVFSHQWLADHSDIIGATSSTYTLTDSDEGKAIRVRASFTDDEGNAESLTSEATAAVSGRPNSPATGTTTISGTLQVGETLTADTSGIEDADGLNNVTFSYQWIRSNRTTYALSSGYTMVVVTDITVSGATDSTYTPVSRDVGAAIKVQVTFTDDAGNEETLISAATAPVAAVPTPLTASTHDAPDGHDGEDSFTFELRFSEEFDLSYATLRNHVFTVTGGAVTQARRLAPPANVRWEITVEPSSDADVSIVLPITTDCDDDGAICTSDRRMLSNRSELTVSGPGAQNTLATGAPAMSGIIQVGQTLSVSTLGVADDDGLTNATFAYQWVRTDGSTDTDISGATDSSYTLKSEDEGASIKVRVSFTDDAGHDENLTSAATAAVVEQNATRRLLSLATLTVGTDDFNTQENLGYSSAAEAGSLSPNVFSLGARTHRVLGLTAILDGTPTVTLHIDPAPTSGQINNWSIVLHDTELALAAGTQVSGTGSIIGWSVSDFPVNDPNLWEVNDQFTVFVQEAVNVAASGAPAITGTAQVGETLAAATSGIVDANGLDGASLSYQWLRVKDGATTTVSGATSSTYTVVDADQGADLKVRVSFTDDDGYAESLNGAAVTVTESENTNPPAAPTNLTATLNSDGTITLTWTAPDDESVSGYQILRRRPQEGETSLTIYAGDTGSTATQYTDTDTALDTRYVYRVKARNPAGVSPRSNFARIDK